MLSSRPTLVSTTPLRRGFTLVELIIVLVLVGILGATALPKMQAMGTSEGPAWREQVLAGLRTAQALSRGHLRMVCVAVNPQELQLTLATTFGSTSCDAPINGADGDPRWARSAQAPATSPITLYFQPNGRITTDAAGTTAVPKGSAITMAGEPNIALVGETGYVN